MIIHTQNVNKKIIIYQTKKMYKKGYTERDIASTLGLYNTIKRNGDLEYVFR